MKATERILCFKFNGGKGFLLNISVLTSLSNVTSGFNIYFISKMMLMIDKKDKGNVNPIKAV